MSKGEILRGFVTERLAAATQEILAVVDRIVAGYEKEASGFRQEIKRQRKQLQVLLEPRVALRKAGVRHSRRLGPAEEEEGEDEEHPEDVEESTHPTSSRAQCKKRKPGRPEISETQSHVDLRIRILEGSHTEGLSNSVLKKSPMQTLKCPRGLQEEDFLDLLKSTFPQLCGDNKLFDVLTPDERRRLQPLRLKTLTPEEILRNISCSGRPKSTLYIRPKACEEEIHQAKDTEDSLSTCDETRPQTSRAAREVEGSRVGLSSSNSTLQQQEVETEEADDGTLEPAEAPVVWSAAESKGNGGNDIEEREQANDSDDDWKPDKSDEELKESDSELPSKMTKRQKSRRFGVTTKTGSSVVVLTCKVCSDMHKSEVALAEHARSHADDLGSVCGVCGELSESVEALKDHLQTRHKTYECHICGESFLSILSLNEHVAAHSGERPYECELCRDAFALKVSLENHQKLHKADKVFEPLKVCRRTQSNTKTHLCGVCGKSLSDYRSLSRHKMTHSGERPHSCQVCGRRFKLPGTLRQHEKIHTERERSYLCDVCCKMFLTSKQLQIHMRTHTNEKPYHCGECGKGFTTKGPLTIHMRVHTGETPYRCPDCGWSFKRKINLDNHVTVHSGHKPFVCGICGKACARKTYLTVHMRTHNGERPYKCTLCDKAFTQSHCLKTHMKSHLVAGAAT